MIFWKLKPKHKRKFIVQKGLVLLALAVALFIAWQRAQIPMPTNVERIMVPVGFITTTSVFVLAILNRVGSIFKIKAFGFIFMALMFTAIQYIVEPLVFTTWLMSGIMLIDDIISGVYWNNLWYNEYDGYVRIQQ